MGVGTVLTVFSTAVSMSQGQKVARATKTARTEEAASQERVQKSQQRIADVKANAAKRKALADKRKQAGFNLAAAEKAGTIQSSVFEGVKASTSTQFAGVLSDATRISEDVKETNIFVQESSDRAQTAIDVASSAQSTATIFGGISDIAGTFKT